MHLTYIFEQQSYIQNIKRIVEPISCVNKPTQLKRPESLFQWMYVYDAKFNGVTVNCKNWKLDICIYRLVTLTVSCTMNDKEKLSEYFTDESVLASIEVMLSYITESQPALSREVNLT